METEDGKRQGNDGEESFADLLEQNFVAPARYEPGQKVSAPVIKVTPDWVFLDLGRKGEGIVSAKELLDEGGKLRVREGDTLPAYFVSAEGSEMLFTTRLAGGAAGTAQLEEGQERIGRQRDRLAKLLG